MVQKSLARKREQDDRAVAKTIYKIYEPYDAQWRSKIRLIGELEPVYVWNIH